MAKAIRVDDGAAFWFRDWNGNVDFVAHDLKEFKKALKAVPAESLEFHLREDKNDLSVWLDGVMKRKAVAEAMWGVKQKCLTGNELRKSLLRCFKPRGKVVPVKRTRNSKSLKSTLRKALVGKRRRR